MNIRQSGVTITIQLSLNKEAALKSLREATEQLKKVSRLQDELLLGMARTGMEVFSLMNSSQFTHSQVESFSASTQSRNSELGKELEEASKRARDMRELAERAIPLLDHYLISSSDENENTSIKKIISDYKAIVTEVLSIGKGGGLEEIEALFGRQTVSSVLPSEAQDPHQELLRAAEKICEKRDEFNSFMRALQDKKYALALRKASAAGSLPLVYTLGKYISVLGINVNEPSSNGWTALDWLENAQSINGEIKEAIRNVLLENHCKPGVRRSSSENTHYGTASSALYTATNMPTNHKVVKLEAKNKENNCSLQ